MTPDKDLQQRFELAVKRADHLQEQVSIMFFTILDIKHLNQFKLRILGSIAIKFFCDLTESMNLSSQRRKFRNKLQFNSIDSNSKRPQSSLFLASKILYVTTAEVPLSVLYFPDSRSSRLTR